MFLALKKDQILNLMAMGARPSHKGNHPRYAIVKERIGLEIR
jgi:hypothetical protein